MPPGHLPMEDSESSQIYFFSTTKQETGRDEGLRFSRRALFFTGNRAGGREGDAATERRGEKQAKQSHDYPMGREEL